MDELARTYNQTNNQTKKQIVGWREWLALPRLGIPAIKAKIDTGARSSALHAFKIEEYTFQGKAMLRFWVHPIQHDIETVLRCEAEIFDKRVVSDSGGHREKRYIIKTYVELGNAEWEIEMSLTNRDSMLFRMLLGRTGLKKRYLVDAGKSFMFGRVEHNDLKDLFSSKGIQDEKKLRL